mgnify:FL=1
MNKVELIGHYGSDKTIALSAWTSTYRDLSADKKKRIPTLIRSLWKDGHETPFEKSGIHFLITTDIATHIHLLKHRIGVSVNAESARYKEIQEDKYLIPEDWPKEWQEKLEQASIQTNKLYHEAVAQLTPRLGRKRAKESARFFKMYNSQITSDVMFNMRSFGHFLKLRNSKHAQLEIRELAQQMVLQVQQIKRNPFKTTIEVICNYS